MQFGVSPTFSTYSTQKTDLDTLFQLQYSSQNTKRKLSKNQYPPTITLTACQNSPFRGRHTFLKCEIRDERD